MTSYIAICEQYYSCQLDIYCDFHSKTTSYIASYIVIFIQSRRLGNDTISEQQTSIFDYSLFIYEIHRRNMSVRCNKKELNNKRMSRYDNYL